MTDNIAVLDGYTQEIYAEYEGQCLYLLVKPDTDFGNRFRAWDIDMQEYIIVNGWMADIDLEFNSQEKA